jgi:lipoprotein NlpI
VKADAGRALSLRGVIQFMLGNVSAARADVEKACQLAPGDPTLWNNRGFLHYKSGNYKAALESFNRALQLDSTYARARYNLGMVLSRDEALPGVEGAQAPGRDPSGPANARAVP